MLNDWKLLKLKNLPFIYKEKIEEELYLIGVDRYEFSSYFEKTMIELVEEIDIFHILNVSLLNHYLG